MVSRIIFFIFLLLGNVHAGTMQGIYAGGGGASSNPSPDDFLYEKQLTFDTTSNGAYITSDQTTFPIAVHINSSSIPDEDELAHFFAENSDCLEVRFYDSDKATELYYEVEYCNDGVEAIYWVKVPTISNNSDTDSIWMFYGNSVFGPKSEASSTWRTEYKMVNHMYDTSTTTVNDTQGDVGTKVGISNPTEVNAQIYKGQDFHTDYVSFDDNDKFSFGNSSADSPFSLCAWAYMDDATSFRIITKASASGTTIYEWGFFTTAADKLALYFFDAGTANSINKTSDATVTGDQAAWHYYCATYTGNGSGTGITLYRDGASIAATAGSVGSYTAMHNTTSTVDIGVYMRLGTPSRADGKIDEVRVYADELTADWIKLEYYSMKNTNYFGDNCSEVDCTGKFITFGAEAAH